MTCICVCACFFSLENDGARSDHDGTSRTTTDITVHENGDTDTDVDDIDDDDGNNSESDGGIVVSDVAEIGLDDEVTHAESSDAVTSNSLETSCSHSSSKLAKPATGPTGTVTIISFLID